MGGSYFTTVTYTPQWAVLSTVTYTPQWAVRDGQLSHHPCLCFTMGSLIISHLHLTMGIPLTTQLQLTMASTTTSQGPIPRDDVNE